MSSDAYKFKSPSKRLEAEIEVIKENITHYKRLRGNAQSSVKHHDEQIRKWEGILENYETAIVLLNNE